MKYSLEFLFFLILLIYPLFCFISRDIIDIDPQYAFGFFNIFFLIYRLIYIYRNGINLKLPYYVVIFGIFTFYAVFSHAFLSNELKTDGIFKYLYSNQYLLTLIVLVIVENTTFPPKWISWAIKILFFSLIVAAIVSIIQIFDPLFFTKNSNLIQGLPFDRFEDYYRNNPNNVTSDVSRIFEKYRFSIYSYINEISVGMDSLAIFSLLIALKSYRWLRSLILVAAAAIISFLSSARWIMLNFLVVASQNVWIGNRIKILNFVKYGFYGIILLLLLLSLMKFTGINIEQFTQDRLLSKSANTRIYAFEVFTKVYPDQPIFGTGGVDTPKMQNLIQGRTSQIHVGYLKLFYYYGLFGGVLYLSFLASLLIRLWKMARGSNYWGSFFALMTFAIANFTLVVFGLNWSYGLILALIFSNHFYENRNDYVVLSNLN